MEITIKAKDVTSKMYFRQALAEGKTEDGRTIEVTTLIPDGSYHIKVGNTAYLISMPDVVNAIVKLDDTRKVKKTLKKKKEVRP